MLVESVDKRCWWISGLRGRSAPPDKGVLTNSVTQRLSTGKEESDDDDDDDNDNNDDDADDDDDEEELLAQLDPHKQKNAAAAGAVAAALSVLKIAIGALAASRKSLRVIRISETH